jgi:ankyrin repeat protein
MIRKRVNYERGRSVASRLANAVEKRNTADARELLNAGASPNSSYGNAPMIFHASAANLRLLLQRGANIDVQNAKGYTLLNLLCATHYPLYQEKDHTERIRFLIENDADPNIPDNEGDTPLHLLCSVSMDPEMARLLLQHGANVNQQNNKGETPLHYLAENVNLADDLTLPYRECIQALLDVGVDPLIKNEDGRTASELAEVRGMPFEVIRMLKQLEKNAGANVVVPNAPAPAPNQPGNRGNRGNRNMNNMMQQYQDPANFNMGNMNNMGNMGNMNNLEGGRRRKTRRRRALRRTRRSKGGRR